MTDENVIKEAVAKAVESVNAEVARLTAELERITRDRDLYRLEVQGLLRDLGRQEKSGRCPEICSIVQSVYGYALDSQCRAEAGHSPYRNMVGHDFPR